MLVHATPFLQELVKPCYSSAIPSTLTCHLAGAIRAYNLLEMFGADASAPTLSKKERAKLYMTRHQFVNRGASQKPGEQDFIVPSAAAKALKPYDKKLRQFQFQDALDMAIGTQDSRIVAMLLEELACRNVLQAALGGTFCVCMKHS